MSEKIPDSETLMSLLKEKAKELKTLQKKLDKVEEKFFQTHKQQKALLKDRDTFVALLKIIFSEMPDTLAEVLLPDNAE